MMENKSPGNRTERIMSSLDGITKAGAPDFFYTRLVAKMQPNGAERSFFMLRPAFLTAVLSVLLVVNIVSLLETDKVLKQDPTVKFDKSANIESFARAYNMNTVSVYE